MTTNGLVVQNGGVVVDNGGLNVSGDIGGNNIYSVGKIGVNDSNPSEALSVGGTIEVLEGLISPTNRNGHGKIYSKMISYASASDAQDKLLMHYDGLGTAFVDSSVSPKTITVSGAASQVTSIYKFGGSSGYFNGSGSSYLKVAGTVLDLASTPFTVEAWVYPKSTSDSHIIGQWSQYTSYSDPAPGYWSLVVYSGKFEFRTPGGNAMMIDSATNVAINTWHHVAVTRDSSNNIRMFINGKLETTRNIAYNFGATTDVCIGQNACSGVGNAWAFNGYIDELRISKGVARWTSDFTPNTAAYGSGSTASALFYMDGSGHEYQLGVAAAPAAPSGPITLIGGTHTSDDCSAVGGVPFNIGDGTYICKMAPTSCVGTWVGHQNWSETTPNTCYWTNTASHYWSNPSVIQESFEYCSRTGRDSQCFTSSTCYANLTLRGCK